MSDLTYLYCVVQREKTPPLARAPRGVPGAGAPRAIDAGAGLWLVASDARAEGYGEAAIERGLSDLAWVSERALPHEAVVEFVGRSGTVLPMKLFTLFHSDERALQHVAGQRKRIDRLLERLAGREEWGIRLLLDEPRALERAAQSARGEAKGASGTEFLLRKKKQRDLSREVIERGGERAAALFDELSRRADDARRRAPPPGPAGRRVLLDAAFLVRRGRAKPFQAAVRKAKERLGRDGYELTLTGPWPPYNFVAESA
jgi:Gas vesicle synthesis protein GvpL/GvpF